MNKKGLRTHKAQLEHWERVCSAIFQMAADLTLWYMEPRYRKETDVDGVYDDFFDKTGVCYFFLSWCDTYCDDGRGDGC